VYEAINLDDARVVEPLSDSDFLPIADTMTYMPERHNCPLPCNVDYTNVYNGPRITQFTGSNVVGLPIHELPPATFSKRKKKKKKTSVRN
jgi:hypothetical protein